MSDYCGRCLSPYHLAIECTTPLKGERMIQHDESTCPGCKHEKEQPVEDQCDCASKAVGLRIPQCPKCGMNRIIGAIPDAPGAEAKGGEAICRRCGVGPVQNGAHSSFTQMHHGSAKCIEALQSKLDAAEKVCAAAREWRHQSCDCIDLVCVHTELMDQKLIGVIDAYSTLRGQEAGK